MKNRLIKFAPPAKTYTTLEFSKNGGFTLAEILVMIVILGIVAVITVPSISHKTIAKTNKIKIRKALAAYEKAVNQMYIENELPRTVQGLKDYANNDNDCSNAMKYFKPTERNGCQFKTSDGLWWDIGSVDNNDINKSNKYYGYSMSKAMVSFKKENLTAYKAAGSSYDTFTFVTDIDTNGSVRVNDITYAKSAFEIEDKNGTKGVYGSRSSIQATTKVQAYLDDQENFGLSANYKSMGSSRSSKNSTITGSTEHDKDGNLICKQSCKVKYMSGSNIIEEEYDKNGNITQRATIDTGNNKTVTTYTYDLDGYETSSTTTKNGQFVSEYISQRDIYGNQTHTEHNYADPSKNTWYNATYEYDGYGRVMYKADESSNGNKTENKYTRDDKGRYLTSSYTNYYPQRDKNNNIVEGQYNISKNEYDYVNDSSKYESSGYSRAVIPNTSKYDETRSGTYKDISSCTKNICTDSGTTNYDDGGKREYNYSYDEYTGEEYHYTEKAYDKNGNITEDWKSSTTKKDGITTYNYIDSVGGSYSYDNYDNNNNHLSSYSYDSKKNRTTEGKSEYNESGKQTSYISYTYNGKDTSSKPISGSELTYGAYSSNGLPTYERRFGTDSKGKPYDTATTRVYDSQGRLISSKTVNNLTGKTTSSSSTTYDENGKQICGCTNGKCNCL